MICKHCSIRMEREITAENETFDFCPKCKVRVKRKKLPPDAVIDVKVGNLSQNQGMKF